MIKTCGILKVNKKFYTKRNSQDAIIIFRKNSNKHDYKRFIKKQNKEKIFAFRTWNAMYFLNLIIDKDVQIFKKTMQKFITSIA